MSRTWKSPTRWSSLNMILVIANHNTWWIITAADNLYRIFQKLLLGLWLGYSTTIHGWNCTGYYLLMACASFRRWPNHSAIWKAMSSWLCLPSTKKMFTASRWGGRSRIHSKLYFVRSILLISTSFSTGTQKLWADPVSFGVNKSVLLYLLMVHRQISELKCWELLSIKRPVPADYPLPRLTVKRYDHVFFNPQLVRTSQTSYSKYDYPWPPMVPITAPGKSHYSQPVDMEQESFGPFFTSNPSYSCSLPPESQGRFGSLNPFRTFN